MYYPVVLFPGTKDEFIYQCESQLHADRMIEFTVTFGWGYGNVPTK